VKLEQRGGRSAKNTPDTKRGETPFKYQNASRNPGNNVEHSKESQERKTEKEKMLKNRLEVPKVM